MNENECGSNVYDIQSNVSDQGSECRLPLRTEGTSMGISWISFLFKMPSLKKLLL